MSRKATYHCTEVGDALLSVSTAALIATIGLIIFDHLRPIERAPLRLEQIESQLATALRSYNLDAGDYPEKLQDLITAPSGARWRGPYIESLARYSYKRTIHYERSAGTSFVLRVEEAK